LFAFVILPIDCQPLDILLVEEPELTGELGLGDESLVLGNGGIVSGLELLRSLLDIVLGLVSLVDNTAAAEKSDGGVVDVGQGLADTLGTDKAALVLETVIAC